MGNQIEIFTPDHPLVIFWNLVMLLVMISQIVAIPLRISFALYYEQTYSLNLILITFPSVACFINIALRFNTAYYSEGDTVKSRMRITSNYFRSNFPIDILTSLALILTPYYTEIP